MPIHVLAQTPVDAGALQQQLERERDTRLPPAAAPDAAPAQQPAITPDGKTVVVRSFRFQGNTLLSEQALANAVAPFLNRPIRFAELLDAAAKVAETYRAAGWLVRVFLPEQDIVDGVVTLQIIEARLGAIKTEEAQPTWLGPAGVAEWVAAQQSTDTPLNARALDRALLLMDDLPGVVASGRLQQGTQPGTTDLVVKLAAEPLANGTVLLDNAGARSTGRERLNAQVLVNSPLGMGDQFTIYGLHAKGMDYARLSQTFPVGKDGWRVGVNLGALRYRVVAPEFAALNGRGSSSSLGVESAYPIIRSRQGNLYFMAGYDSKRFDNQSGGATASKYSTRGISASLRGNLFDQMGGGGATHASLGVMNGKLDLGTVDVSEDADLNGHYRKLVYSLSRQQVVTPAISLFGALTGQHSDERKLDSSEKFYLGGVNGVRAYPASEGSGVSGNTVNLEARWRLPAGFQASAFYDWGAVRNPGGRNYSLEGAGLGLAWQSDAGLQLRAQWAHRIGDNPNPTGTGKDQDGSLVKNRVWLQASLHF
ncbi:MAG: ShlB/FhaC/HecB family hemolysin secretion/activation protein [Gammaproteobacteria bacterium]